MIDLAAIKAYCAATPPGPWESDDSEIYGPGRVWIAESLHTDDVPGGNAIAAFIAHARTDVPALVESAEGLIAALRDAEAEVERLRAEVGSLKNSVHCDRPHIVGTYTTGSSSVEL